MVCPHSSCIICNILYQQHQQIPKWSGVSGQIRSDQLHSLLGGDFVCDSVLFCWNVTKKSIVMMSPHDPVIDLNNALNNKIKNW